MKLPILCNDLYRDLAEFDFWITPSPGELTGLDKYALKQFGHGVEQNLLSPIVVPKVQGSVNSSVGVKPEEILREYLEDWGLIPDEDFNTNNVIVQGDEDEDVKTRTSDFVLPYKTPGWFPEWQKRIMMQSQFYAGDSGSVSPKRNVDQTKTSRACSNQISKYVIC